MDSIITETKVGGLRAVELYYRGIREFESGETTFLQSKTRLNTPDLGTMMPEAYRKVAELSTQCLTLFDFELQQLTETIKSLQDRDFYLPSENGYEKRIRERMAYLTGRTKYTETEELQEREK